MAATKRWFVEQAYDAIGMGTYIFDLPTDALQSALAKLDAMMASWDSLGIRLGWPQSVTPGNADLDQEVNLPLYAREAVTLNLAKRIAPAHGKEVSMDTKAAARAAYNVLLNKIAQPREMQMPATMPRGAGQKSLDNPFVTPPDTDPLPVGDNGQLRL